MADKTCLYGPIRRPKSARIVGILVIIIVTVENSLPNCAIQNEAEFDRELRQFEWETAWGGLKLMH